MNNYKFFPNSYDYDKIKELDIFEEHFLKLQIKYRNDFEQLLNGIINFQSIDNALNDAINIPVLDDSTYNFYHKYSSLNSKYVYLRNNIHIENLSKEEINTIEEAMSNGKNINTQFLIDTFKKVLYEGVDGKSMFGMENNNCIIDSDCLVFELSFAQKKFTDINQFRVIENLLASLKPFLESSIGKMLDTKISLLKYNGLVDIYLDTAEADILQKFK